MIFTLLITVLLTGIVLVVAAYAIAKLIGPRSYNPVKGEPFECGIPTYGSSWVPMHVGYYLFAILFLMFDVETVFLYPWATVFGQLSGEYGGAMLFSIGFFMLVLVFGLAYAFGHNRLDLIPQFADALYFEASAVILALVTVGKFMEARAKSHTSDAIKALMNLTPKTAIVKRHGLLGEIPLADVVTGDVLIVKSGASVPVDGTIIEGSGALDESAITGESLPVDKSVGDKVTGGTINQSGYFKMQATAVGANTTLAKIIALVDEATSSKAPIAKLADKVSGVFVPVVISIALIAVIVWLLLGYGFEFALSIGISVLVISCLPAWYHRPPWWPAS